MANPTLSGGCFCGAIRYQLTGALTDARSCHCSQCRKAFSGAGSAYAVLSEDATFEWTSGEEHLQTYGQQWGLAFCSTCGTTLCGVFEGKVHGITLGPIDGDPDIQIEKHIFVGSKASWDHIGGDAPQFDEHAM